MNRSRIEWCDHTWNPVTGCRHECPYCYARRMVDRFAGDVRLNKMARKDYSMAGAADGGGDLFVLDAPMLNETGRTLAYPFGFEPTLHRYRMDYPGKLKMGKNIFVGAMSDVFGGWVPDGWLDEIFEACMRHSVHNYLFLTKNPKRYLQYGVPEGRENLWYGTTITRREELKRIGHLPARARTFVSVEPILEDLHLDGCPAFGEVDWIIIGAETGRNRQKVVPRLEWIGDVLSAADAADVPVFMKESLVPVVGEANMRRDFPGQLRHSEISPKMKKRLFDICAECKAHRKKSDMVALLARSKRGEQPKQFGFMCRDCFGRFCRDLGLNVLELAELADCVTIGPDDGDG